MFAVSRKWICIGLEIIGGAATLCFLAFAALIAWSIFSMTPLYAMLSAFMPVDTASVLKWGGMQDAAEVEQVIRAKVSERSFTGDHLDEYIFKMKRFSTEKALSGGLWRRGPLQDEIQKKAVDFALMMEGSERGEGGFPTKIASKPYLFCFPWIALADPEHVYASIVMVYDPETLKLYVIDGKT
jgi:hypothetical protein